MNIEIVEGYLEFMEISLHHFDVVFAYGGNPDSPNLLPKNSKLYSQTKLLPCPHLSPRAHTNHEREVVCVCPRRRTCARNYPLSYSDVVFVVFPNGRVLQ